MDFFNDSYKLIVKRLKEREKELNCLYRVNEILNDEYKDLPQVFRKIIQTMPTGWQHPTICEVCIRYNDQEYQTDDFISTEWEQTASLIIDNNIVGTITVVYTQKIHENRKNQFFPEEQKLLNTIADKLSDYIFRQKLFNTVSALKNGIDQKRGAEIEMLLSAENDEHWKWRMEMANIIASKLDFKKFKVKGVYIIGSTKNASAGPASDIDLMIHIEESIREKELLEAWIDGWSLCLSEMNYKKTGYRIEKGLVDLHIITDQDIKNKTSYAVMIGAITDRARPLRLKNE